MDEFVTTLKSIYRERQLFTEDQWLRVSGDKLINLQLVEGDKREGFYAKQGTVKQTRIVSENLFNGEKPVKKVLVEGNGGMGKTTLCTMITEGWAEEKMLTQFECLVFLPLREEDIASAESVPDLLKLLHPSQKICTSVVSNLEDSVGKGLLIVADGWDELSESKRCKSSFLYKLLFGRVLPFASVLLTSRPSASADLHRLPLVDRLVEVVGFTEDNIKQYIECEFEKCPEKAYALIEQLANNPLIQSVCAVPLNCAITCSLWYTLDQQLPTTLTELYTLIILNVILRNINKLSDLKSKSTLKSFDSIPSQLQPYWWLTCKFAFETLSRDQLVFTEDEVASLFPEGFESSQQLLYFGLLQSTHSYLPVGHGLSFHFLHLTFQEYLAALHLVTLSIEEQMEVLQKYGSTSRFQMVFRFFFGLGSDKPSHYSGYVSKKVICSDEKVFQIFLSLKFWSHDSSNNRLQSDCALESRNEVFSCKIAQHIGITTPCCRNPNDYIANLYVLSHTSNCDSIYIDMMSCGLTDKLLDRLTDILSAAHGKLNVSVLNLNNNKLTGRGISDLLNKASISLYSIRNLSLRSNSLHGDCVDSIVSSLIHTSCKSLSGLYLSDNPLELSGIQALERAAVAGTLVHLECLNLANTFTSDADINGALLTIFLASLSSHCPRLKDLYLSNNNLGVPGVCALGEALLLLINGKSKFSLTLDNTMLDIEAISAFTDSLERNSKPTSSKPLIPHNGNQSQSRSLSTLSKCFCLTLDNNPLHYSGALVMLRLLSNETCLITDLRLSNIDISNVTKSDSLVDMFEPFTNNHRLTRLDLCENNLSGEGVHLIVKFMNVCQSLKRIDCNNCKLTSGDIRQIISLLSSTSSTSCSKLKYWSLWGNNIDDVGVAALVKCIPDLFPSLVNISLWSNPVYDEMIQKLEECLKVIGERRKAKEEAERESQRIIALCEWVKTQSLPQDQQLLDEFMEMWNELFQTMIYSCQASKFIKLEVIQSENEDFPQKTTNSDDELTALEEDLSKQAVPKPLCYSIPSSRDQWSTDESSSPSAETHVRLSPQGAGGLETDTGVPDLTLNTLTVELELLTNPKLFGIYLNIPQHKLEIIEQNDHHDIVKQKIALFSYLASNSVPLCLSWTKIADALKTIHGDLALSIRQKYCSEIEEPANVNEQPTSQSALTITTLQNEFNLTDEQIDCPIQERDLFNLGDLFRAWNMYAGDPGLQLNKGEQHTISVNSNLIDNRMRMKEALKTWQRRNPLTATFRNLLNIVLEFSDGSVAKKISLYVKNLK